MLWLLGLLLQRSLAAMVASVLNGGDWRPKNIGKAEPLKKEFFYKKSFLKSSGNSGKRGLLSFVMTVEGHTIIEN